MTNEALYTNTALHGWKLIRYGPPRRSGGRGSGMVGGHARLTTAMAALPPEEWLKKHNAASVEDVAKDPLLNRLSVLQTRTTHGDFQAGQIRLALTKG